MKAQLVPQEIFNIDFGGYVVEGMRVVSRWNGLIELRNKAGEVLIVSAPEQHPAADAFSTIFGDIFRTAEETKAAGTVIIAGSTKLLESIRRFASAG